jgi:translation elongation factor EF-Tu-like GTPase
MHYNAVVKFLFPEDGGRTTPPQSGYRPQLKLGDIQTSCMILSPNDDEGIMSFGKEHYVQLKLIFPEYQKRITSNMGLEFYEGSRLVGIGKIQE